MAANGFTFDKTHYAVQKQSTLAVHFDSVRANSRLLLPLNVYVRAYRRIHSTSWGATESMGTDDDANDTRTQVSAATVLTPSAG